MPYRTYCASIGLLLFFLLLFAQASHAIPPLVSYQGKVNDSAGEALTGTYQMIFRLYDFEASAPMWAEQQTVNITGGIYTVYLGAGANIVGGGLAAALFSAGDRWLEVEIQGEVLSPRQQLSSVVYAFRAEEADHAMTADDADTLDGLDSTQFLGAAGGELQGDLVVRGDSGFNAPGEEGVLYLGDSFNYIKAEYDFGLRLGAFGAPEALSVEAGSGNVGIGVADPAHKLDVAGNLHTSGVLTVGSDTKSLSVFTSGLVVDLKSNGAALGINYPGDTDTVINVDGGRVGIGTAAPASKLSVDTLSINGISAHTASTNAWGTAAYGQNTGAGFGVYGWSQANDGTVGVTVSDTPAHAGVHGINNGEGRGVYGFATGDDGVGVFGESGSAAGNGVEGRGYYGVTGQGTQIGVYGQGGQYGVWATASVPSPGAAIGGLNSAANGIAVSGTANGENGIAVRGEATGTNGTAVMAVGAMTATGDLFVGGAYKGNLGPNNGAPFPRPVYDSGWVDTDDDNVCVELDTGLDTAIYNNQHFVIDIQQQGYGGTATNREIGGEDDFDGFSGWWQAGFWYAIQSDNDILLCQGDDWGPHKLRARIWYYK
jgi:hypothetical protein